jgi:NTE family protein
MASSKQIGLVLQGGGALGAFEYGVVTELVAQGYQPVAVTGVSIGAINAAAIAGAPQGDIAVSLQRMWESITLPAVPWLPKAQQGNLSLLGNPQFWRSRTDYLNMARWDSFCDTSPMLATLASHCDFDQINNPGHIRIGVTATDLHTGGQVTFSNYFHGGGRDDAGNHQAHATVLTPSHILASGSLPPGFPPVEIEGRLYWDGGLFNNTPIDALLNLLTPDEVAHLPIYVVDLFPTAGLPAPKNLVEVQSRALSLQYQNRFWADYGGSAELEDFVQMLEQLAALGKGNPIEQNGAYAWLLRLRALKNLRIIDSAPVVFGDDHDFSPYGVEQRCAAGRAAVREHLAQNAAPRVLARAA